MDVKMLWLHPKLYQWVTMLLALCLFLQVIVGMHALIFFIRLPIEQSKNYQGVSKKMEERATLQTVVQAPFFGDYIPKNINEAGVSPSLLDIKILGILFSKDEKASQVIILTPENNQRIFRVGDVLPGGAIIQHITQDGILIGRNGQLERLSLPQNELIFEKNAAPLQFSE